MNLVVKLTLIILCVGCKPAEVKNTINITEVINSPSYYDNKKLSLVTKVSITDSGSIRLHDINSDSFIDMVFTGQNQKNNLSGAKNKNGCFVVVGTFKEYNNDFIGMGNLVSEIGVFEAEDIKPCKLI